MKAKLMGKLRTERTFGEDLIHRMRCQEMGIAPDQTSKTLPQIWEEMDREERLLAQERSAEAKREAQRRTVQASAPSPAPKPLVMPTPKPFNPEEEAAQKEDKADDKKNHKIHARKMVLRPGVSKTGPKQYHKTRKRHEGKAAK